MRCLFQILRLIRITWRTRKGIIRGINLYCRLLGIHHHFRIIHRNVRTPLYIKINLCNARKLSYGIANGSHENLPYCLFIFKLNLCLNRMDIHINILWIHLEIDEIRNLITRRHKTLESHLHSLMEVRMFHISSVDEEELLCTLLSSTLRLAHESCYLTKRGGSIKRKERLVYLLAKDIYDTLTKRSCGKVHHLLTIII